jgi:hypothetical protein
MRQPWLRCGRARPGDDQAWKDSRWRRAGAVGRLRDRPQTPIADAPRSCEQSTGREPHRRAASGVGADQPGPDGALVGRTSCSPAHRGVQVCRRSRPVRGAQAERRQQLPGTGRDHSARSVAVTGERGVGSDTRQQLVRSHGGVVAAGPSTTSRLQSRVRLDGRARTRLAPGQPGRPALPRVRARREPGRRFRAHDPRAHHDRPAARGVTARRRCKKSIH